MAHLLEAKVLEHKLDDDETSIIVELDTELDTDGGNVRFPLPVDTAHEFPVGSIVSISVELKEKPQAKRKHR